jgi:hypothetical protein
MPADEISTVFCTLSSEVKRRGLNDPECFRVIE